MRFQFRCLVIALILGFLVPQFASATDNAVRVTAQNAKVRLKPDASSIVIMSVGAGTVLDVIGGKGNWFEVSLPPGENGLRRTGFISQTVVESVQGPKPDRSAGVPASIGEGGNASPRVAQNVGGHSKLPSDHREGGADQKKVVAASAFAGLWEVDDADDEAGFPNTLLKVTKMQNGRFQLVEKFYSPHAASEDSRIWLPPVDLDMVNGRLEGIYKNSNSRLTLEFLSNGALQYKIASEYGVRTWKAVRVKSETR